MEISSATLIIGSTDFSGEIFSREILSGFGVGLKAIICLAQHLEFDEVVKGGSNLAGGRW